MQKTKFRELIDSSLLIVKPIISDSWTKRSLSFLFLLSGFYFTNSLLSFLLDKNVNTIFLSIFLILIMEVLIRLLIFSKISKLSIIILSINNFRIGATYALILEAFKLGS